MQTNKFSFTSKRETGSFEICVDNVKDFRSGFAAVEKYLEAVNRLYPMYQVTTSEKELEKAIEKIQGM